MGKIQSLGGLESNCVTLVYDDAEKKKFRKCPFPQCDLHHVEGLEICDTTGKSITEEAKRREEKAIRRIAADRVKARYEKEYLSGWKKRWLDIVFFLGALGLPMLAYILSLASGLKVGSSVAFSVAVWLAWCYFWGDKVNKYVKQIKAQADETYQRTLKGEKAE